MKDEVLKLNTNVNDKRERNKEKEKKINELKVVLNEVNNVLRESELDYEKNNSDLSNF